jgi:hypothetical protein
MLTLDALMMGTVQADAETHLLTMLDDVARSLGRSYCELKAPVDGSGHSTLIHTAAFLNSPTQARFYRRAIQNSVSVDAVSTYSSDN